LWQLNHSHLGANENSNWKMAIREQTKSNATNNMEGEVGRRRPVTYLDAEDLIMGEIDEWRREQADEMRGDKLMVLLRAWEQHGAAAAYLQSHAESEGERRGGAEAQKSESEVQNIEKSEGWTTNNPCPAPSNSAGERREDEAEGEEDEEEKAKAEWEVELARLEGKMSSMVLLQGRTESKGKRAERDKKNESEAAAAKSNAGGADAEAVQACDAGSGDEKDPKLEKESDGKQVRAGMKQLLQRTHVARELVRTEEDYVDFLSNGLVAVRLFPFSIGNDRWLIAQCPVVTQN
jgi:hypothetical protein